MPCHDVICAYLPPKTIICPKTTTIRGWIRCHGTLQASPHHMATLSTCSPPEKVSGMRSFIGAYNMLSRVLPQCASYTTPLDAVTAGRESCERIKWTDHLCKSFQVAQSALASTEIITLPQPEDELWLITDGAVKKHGIASTLYVIRGNKLKLAGFFSAKLRGHQITWLPCEIEALSIAASIKHFSPTLYSPYTVLLLSQTANHVCRPLRNYAGESFLPAHTSPHSFLESAAAMLLSDTSLDL